MVNTLPAPKVLITNEWVEATWDEFWAITQRPELEKACFYYDAGCMRIEDMPTGSAHGRDHCLLSAVVSLFGTLKNLPFISLDNTSFHKLGEKQCQPDLAFYLGASLPDIPHDNSSVNADMYGSPTLAIEISASTLSDDLGPKRLLYERLDVREYWVVDTKLAKITAFAVADGGSKRIDTSSVLPNLPLSVVEEALKISQQEKDRGVADRWLLEQFSPKG